MPASTTEHLTLDGIHTCHDECYRPLCVARRESARLREARDKALEEAAKVASNIVLPDDEIDPWKLPNLAAAAIRALKVKQPDMLNL